MLVLAIRLLLTKYMKRVKLTKQQVLSIAEWRRKGETNKEIAEKLGVHEQTVYYWVQRLNKSGHDIPKLQSGVKKMEL